RSASPPLPPSLWLLLSFQLSTFNCRLSTSFSSQSPSYRSSPIPFRLNLRYLLPFKLGTLPPLSLPPGLSSRRLRTLLRRRPRLFFPIRASRQRLPHARTLGAPSRSRAVLRDRPNGRRRLRNPAHSVGFKKRRRKDQTQTRSHVEIRRIANEEERRMGSDDRQPDAAAIPIYIVRRSRGRAAGPAEKGFALRRRRPPASLHDRRRPRHRLRPLDPRARVPPRPDNH